MNANTVTDILNPDNIHNPSGSCPITAIQAAAMLLSLKDLKAQTMEVKLQLSKVELAIVDQGLANARKEGYKQAAGLWFKVGVSVAALSLIGGVILILSVAFGNLDLITLLKSLNII